MAETRAPRILGPKEFGYTDLLDYEITKKVEAEKQAKKEGKTKSHPLRPSAAGFCARKLAYDLMEYRGHAWYDFPVIEPTVYRLFELGHSVEYTALRTFQLVKVMQQKYKQQILPVFELVREGDLPSEIIEGQCDFVLWSEKHRCIGDVKSKKDRFSTAYRTAWDEEIEKFKELPSLVQLSETAFYADDLDALLEDLGPENWLCDNLYQLNLYANSEFIKSKKIDHCFLYRYNKNDSRHLEIRFRPSKKAFEKVRAKFQAIIKAVDKKDPEKVQRDFVLGSARCAYCPANKMCWDLTDAKKAFYGTLPKKTWPKNLDSKTAEGRMLQELFAQYEANEKLTQKTSGIEANILKIMSEGKLERIQLANNHVYEIKFLKSPRPHYEIRRSKL